MIQALSAAHRLNIAHRDFKSANVILCAPPDPPGTGEMVLPPGTSDASTASKPGGSTSGQQAPAATGSTQRVTVKVTDFGLARSIDGLDTTAQGEIWGTPDYMAPEQFRGQSGVGSDIYSLGVVIYEMFTGKLPHRSSSGPKRPDGGPSADTEKIPAEWRPIVQKCLAYHVADRYATVDDVWTALNGGKPGSKPRTILGLSGRAAALIALLIILLLGIAAWAGRPRSPSSSGPSPNRSTLPSCDFGTSETTLPMRRSAPASVKPSPASFRSWGRSQQFFWVVPFSDSRKYEDVEQAHRNLNATLVVTGSVQHAGNTVRITANLIDANTHRQLASRVMTASVGDLNLLQDQVWESVAEMVDLQVGADERKKLQQGSTTKPGAYDYYEKGVGYLQHSDLASVDQAIGAFQRSAAEDPNYALAKAGLGSAYARKYYLTRDIQWIGEATTNGNRAVALNPNLAPVREALGGVYELTGKLDEAKAEYTRALALNPASITAPVRLGKIYALQGKYPEAEAAYKQVIARMPSYSLGYALLGELYFNIGRFKEAAAQFQQMVDRAPDNPSGYSNLGGAYMQMGRYEEAIAVFKKGLGISPNADTWSNLGAAYMFTGENAKAVEAMQKATELKPHDHRVWRNLADSYRQVPALAARAPDTYRKALEVAQEQLTINPEDADALDGVALYQAHLGEKSEARNYIKQALKAAPNDSDVLFTTALTYELIGDREQALAYLRRSLQAGFSLDDVKHEPELLALRSDPRYVKMTHSLGPKPD